MTDIGQSSVILYHRRNDRSPEKDFDQRDDSNKKISCEVRRAVERTRNKISGLQDEVDERDSLIETERSLRIAAENRLQECLVDPYNDSKVNDELRHRLPRARKEDPKSLHPQTDTARTEDPKSLHSQTDTAADDSREVTDVMDSQQTFQTDRPPSPDQVAHNNKCISPMKTALGLRTKNDVVKSLKYPQLYRPGPMMVPPGAGPMMAPSGAYSYNLSLPHLTPEHTDDQSEKMDTSLSVSELQTEELPPREGQYHTPHLTSHSFTSPSGIRTYHPVSVLPSYTSQLSPADQSKQVALLLSELDAARAQNKKLLDKLVNLELDLETERIKSKVKEAGGQTDAAMASALVQEVHNAQKRKEEAMMGRIKVANQERDESMFRLSELERRFEESLSRDSDDIDDELDIQESFDHLLSRVGHYDFPAAQEYTSLVQKLEQMKQRQREIASDEMQTIMEQRDYAMAKAKKLEEELMKRQREDNYNNDQNLMAELDIVKKERELALAKVRQLQDENETIRIYSSLHKSLSQEPLHHINNTLYSNKTKMKENNTLIAELQDVTIHRDQLQADLEKQDRKFKESQTQIKKLETLVTLLRKKLRNSDIMSED